MTLDDDDDDDDDDNDDDDSHDETAIPFHAGQQPEKTFLVSTQQLIS